MRTMCNERVPRGLRYIAGDPAPASAPPPAPAPIPKCDNCRTFDFLICDGAEPCGTCEDIGYAFGAHISKKWRLGNLLLPGWEVREVEIDDGGGARAR